MFAPFGDGVCVRVFDDDLETANSLSANVFICEFLLLFLFVLFLLLLFFSSSLYLSLLQLHELFFFLVHFVCEKFSLFPVLI